MTPRNAWRRAAATTFAVAAGCLGVLSGSAIAQGPAQDLVVQGPFELSPENMAKLERRRLEVTVDEYGSVKQLLPDAAARDDAENQALRLPAGQLDALDIGLTGGTKPAVSSRFAVSALQSEPTDDGLRFLDPALAVGPAHIGVVTAHTIAFYNKDGSLADPPFVSERSNERLDFPMPLDTGAFFSAFTRGTTSIIQHMNANSFRGADRAEILRLQDPVDARVIFDPYRNRFVIATLWINFASKEKIELGEGAVVSPVSIGGRMSRRTKIIVAVSNGPDPRSGWRAYWIDGVMDDGACDQPHHSDYYDPGARFLFGPCPNSWYRPGDAGDYPWLAADKDSILISDSVANRPVRHPGYPEKVVSRYTQLAKLDAQQLATGCPGGCDPGRQIAGVVETAGNIRRAEGDKNREVTPVGSYGKEPYAGDDRSMFVGLERVSPGGLPLHRLHLWRLGPSGTAERTQSLPLRGWRPFLGAPQFGVPNLNPGLSNPPRFSAWADIITKAVVRENRLHLAFTECLPGGSGCRPALRLVRVRLPNTVEVDRTYGLGYYWPSVDVNSNGTAAVSFNFSAKGRGLEARAAQIDPGAAGPGPSALVARAAFPCSRNCGYDSLAGAAVDPFDDVGVWTMQGYGHNACPGSPEACWPDLNLRLAVAKVIGPRFPELFALQNLTTAYPHEVRVVVKNRGDESVGPVQVRLKRSFFSTYFARTPAIPPGGEGEAVFSGLNLPLGAVVELNVDNPSEFREYNERNNRSYATVVAAPTYPPPDDSESDDDDDDDNDRRRRNRGRDRPDPPEEPCPPGSIRVGGECVLIPR